MSDPQSPGAGAAPPAPPPAPPDDGDSFLGGADPRPPVPARQGVVRSILSYLAMEGIRIAVGCVIMGLFAFAMVTVLKFAVPVENRDIAMYMIGQLSGFTAAIVFWIFGSSSGSSARDERLARLLQHESAQGQQGRAP